jgi:hypothetical protein
VSGHRRNTQYWRNAVLAFATRGAQVAVAGPNPTNDSLEKLKATPAAHSVEALYIHPDILSTA